MRLSTKLRYSLLALAELANHNDQDKPLMVHTIASRRGLPTKYLENLLISLKRAGIVKSIRGRNGGYILGRPANRISIAEVAAAIEGPIIPTECIRNISANQKTQPCPAYDLWCEALKLVDDYFQKTTIATLANRPSTIAGNAMSYNI